MEHHRRRPVPALAPYLEEASRMNVLLTAMAVSIWLLMNHHALFAHVP
jgi:hypothetical protein